MGKGVSATPPPPSGKIPPQKPPDIGRVLWCLKYLQANHKTFRIDRLPKKFGRLLLERFCEYGKWPFSEFAPNKSIHSHRVDIERIKAHGGWDHVAEELWHQRPWQFQLQSKTRIIGFILGSTFHIVWIDEEHKFDPRKG
jgi:hypothetical protein